MQTRTKAGTTAMQARTMARARAGTIAMQPRTMDEARAGTTAVQARTRILQGLQLCRPEDYG